MGNPVRKTKVRTRGVRGRFNSRKVGRLIRYESLNEKYLFKTLEVDPFVSTYCEQPTTINYKFNGKSGTYTPDVLSTSIHNTKILYEAKPQSELDKDNPRLEAKLLAAYEYCQEHGWEFQVITESIKISDAYARADLLLPHLMHPGLNQNTLDSILDKFEKKVAIPFLELCPNLNWHDENYRYILHLIGLGKLIEAPYGTFDCRTVIKVFNGE